MFSYFKLRIHVLNDLLGTNPECSIYHDHIIQKTRKLAQEASKLGSKCSKALKKYQGTTISESDELSQLQGLLKSYIELSGEVIEIPDTVEGVLEAAKIVEEKWKDIVDNQEATRATIFMRDPKTNHPYIASHLLLGNIKAICTVLTNNNDKSIFKYKSQLAESMSMDIKVVEDKLFPMNEKGEIIDIEKNDLGERSICERPLRFNTPQGVKSAIATSEILKSPEFECTLRARSGSVFTESVLHQIFSYGRQLGLGAWRNAGHGNYLYQLEPLPDFKEDFGDLSKKGWI
jgi:hypothetical protein